VTEKILELKKANRWWGIKRIAQVLRRVFFMQASAETVRTRLHEANLMDIKRPKVRRNLSRPRFFERATPNQLWQTDLFTFRLGGRYAYLVAFMDDYSRFIVGAELMRSPTAQAVIEVFRVAASEYQPPKEMLTDNGPQYATWRGTSRFEKEMRKERIVHIKSRPQHPMTLGKVERFWATIWQDFLCRAQFESFESARERIKLWIRYYNHRKPHQGIGGLCPADRYFEIQSELRKTIEAGIQENLLEMALRGAPRAPFYMVGRMEGQSVVLRAEKGKLKLSVNDETQHQTKELEYDLDQNKQPELQRPCQTEQGAPQAHAGSELQCAGESAGGAGRLDREGAPGRCLPADAHPVDDLQPVAGAGDGGDASSAREPGEPGRRPGAQPALANALAEAAACNGGDSGPAGQPLRAASAAGDEAAAPSSGQAVQGTDEQGAATSQVNEKEPAGSPGAGASHPPGPLGPVHRQRGSAATGHLAQDLLPVGEAGIAGDAQPARTTAAGPAGEDGRPATGRHAGEDPKSGSEARSGPADGRGPGHPHGDATDRGQSGS
jgi:transposase InsO family protein